MEWLQSAVVLTRIMEWSQSAVVLTRIMEWSQSAVVLTRIMEWLQSAVVLTVWFVVVSYRDRQLSWRCPICAWVVGCALTWLEWFSIAETWLPYCRVVTNLQYCGWPHKPTTSFLSTLQLCWLLSYLTLLDIEMQAVVLGGQRQGTQASLDGLQCCEACY